MPTFPNPPNNVPIVDKDTGKTTSIYRDWLNRVKALLDGIGTDFAPSSATYITQTANSDLSGEQALSSLNSGFVKVTTGSGVLTSTGNNKIQASELEDTSVVIGTYGNSTQAPVITVDQQGRITAATNTTISGTTPGGSAGGDLSGTYPNPTISASWAGSTGITTLGTISTGTWSGTTIAVNKGGTGQTSYTDGQLLIGNTTGNTLTKASLTAGANITITPGSGSITIASTASGGGGWNRIMLTMGA